jgi:hypothetical protein
VTTWFAGGSGTPLPDPAASCTRKCSPGSIVPDKALTFEIGAVPALPAARYCSDQPVRGTGSALELYSSTKSCVYDAPALPPPPYTSLMITPDACGIAALAGAAGANDSPTMATVRDAKHPITR